MNRAPRYYAGFAVAASFTCAYLFFPSTLSRAAQRSEAKALSVDHFTPSIVLSNDDAGPNTKLLTLKVNPSLVPPRLRDRTGTSIYSLFVKDSDIQVERPYTPLESADVDGKLRFWVKRYEKGEVGRWLHARRKGDVVELRGPVTTWDSSWRPNEEGWDEVIMISGGTGITPFYQFLHSMFAHPSEPQTGQRTQLTLLHASKTPADLPPSSILGPLSKIASENPDVFKMHLFVDSIPEKCSGVTNYPPLQVGRISRAGIEQCLDLDHPSQSRWASFWRKKVKPSPRKRRLFLVCGPESMINSVAGPYGRNFSQGLVGGILGDIGCTSAEVWKL